MSRAIAFLALLAVIAIVAIAQSQPTPVTVQPAYGGAPYQLLGAQGPWSEKDARRAMALLESIDKRLAAIETQTPPKPRADILPIAKQRCAACHTPAKAEDKGGGFILFASDLADVLKPLSAREKSRIKESVIGGTMPPNGKLSQAEQSAFEWR